MTLRTVTICLLLSVATTAIAAPKPKQPTAEEKAKEEEKKAKQQKANEHFEKGRNAYNFGNYDEAIKEYQAAFDLTGASEFIFNIAQTYRSSHKKREALAAYKKYIELDPSGAGVESAKSHIEALEAEIKAEEAAEAARKKAEEDAERKRIADAERARIAAEETAKREAVLAAQRRVAAAEDARRQKNARYFRIAGLASTGTGVATLGVAALFGLRARSLSREASDVTGMWTEEAERNVEKAESSERTMFILLGAGAAVTVTGGILYYVGWRRGDATEDKRVTLTPVPTANGGALVLGGRF